MMKVNVNIPTIDDSNKITAHITCEELNKSAEVEIDFASLLPFASSPNQVAVDLFFIASFAYGIDRFIERHSYSEDGWSRKLIVTFPVYDLDKWNKLVNEIEQLLSFLTGDFWSVIFYQNNLVIPKHEMPENLKDQFSQVNLFSGGLDSLIGAIDFLKGNPSKKLLVVSHYDPHISARKEQTLLRDKLTEKYGANFNFIPSVSVSLNYSELEKEKTFRSRSLLFISIAVLVANCKNLPILVPENGTVSLNFPLSSSRRSACSTRTTHPTFLHEVKHILSCLGLTPSIVNIYDLKTKGEMVNECKDLVFLKTIYSLSNSCGKGGHKVNWTDKNQDHCGVCMPCIYRQAALQSISDGKGYGNSINKKFTGRKDQTPFLLSKQGQDFNACLDFLRQNLSDGDIRTELLVNGVRDLIKLDDYVELVKRSRNELREWIKKTGNREIKQKAGL